MSFLTVIRYFVGAALAFIGMLLLIIPALTQALAWLLARPGDWALQAAGWCLDVEVKKQ